MSELLMVFPDGQLRYVFHQGGGKSLVALVTIPFIYCIFDYIHWKQAHPSNNFTSLQELLLIHFIVFHRGLLTAFVELVDLVML